MNDASELREKFNLTMEDVWKEFFYLSHGEPFMILRCAEIVLPPHFAEKDERAAVIFICSSN